MIAGVILFCVGVAWQFGWIQALKLGRLPGDIHIEREGLQVYIPITTMILISALLTALGWLFGNR
jgi:hypothetical protein